MGLRDVYVVAPAATFHHHHHQHYHNQESTSSLFSSPTTSEQQQPPFIPPPPFQLVDPHHNISSRSKSGIISWQRPHHHHHHPEQNPNISNPNDPNSIHPSYLKKPFAMLDNSSILTTTLSSGVATGATITCQDCGNQAKKDCSHRRCRTCCKSRGFDCFTHVRSTWVPAARRRERQLSASTAPAAGGSSASTSTSKKPRLLPSPTSTSNTTPSFDTSSSHHQDGSNYRESLPSHVRAPAVFRCVRVTSLEDDGEDEYAYQAMVKIGGHVFRGFLYDQGEETAENNSNNDSHNTIPKFSELHLGAASTSGAGERNGSAVGEMVSAGIYGSAGGSGGFLGGTNYGNPMN